MQEIQLETKKKKNKLVLLVTTLVLALGLVVAVKIVQIRQENRSKAAYDMEPCSATSCNTCSDESECRVLGCRWLYNGFSHFCTK